MGDLHLAAEPNDDPGYCRRAAEVAAGGVEVEQNEYGCWRSVHWCATCGDRFTITPPNDLATFGPNCLAPECPSYDPARDVEVFFAPDDPDLIEDS